MYITKVTFKDVAIRNIYQNSITSSIDGELKSHLITMALEKYSNLKYIAYSELDEFNSISVYLCEIDHPLLKNGIPISKNIGILLRDYSASTGEELIIKDVEI